MAANEAKLQQIETPSNPCLASDSSILQPLQPLQPDGYQKGDNAKPLKSLKTPTDKHFRVTTVTGLGILQRVQS